MQVFARTPKRLRPAHRLATARDIGALLSAAHLAPAEVCASLGCTPQALSQAEAERRLKAFGLNTVTREHRTTCCGSCGAVPAIR